MLDIELAGELLQPLELRAFAGDHALDAGRDRFGERPQHQVEPLERRQPRHAEQVVAVAIVPIVALRRRRIQHVGLNAAEALQPRLHGARDHEAPLHLAQQVFVDAVDQRAARALP